MNKKTLIAQIANKHDFKKAIVKTVVEDLFDLITQQLVKGQTVRLVGFGVFEIRRRIARDGRNPQTGAKIKIKATKTPSFLAGKALKDAVKGRKSAK